MYDAKSVILIRMVSSLGATDKVIVDTFMHGLHDSRLWSTFSRPIILNATVIFDQSFGHSNNYNAAM